MRNYDGTTTKWFESYDLIAGSAWVLGNISAIAEYKAAELAKTPSERARHLNNAATLNLASSVGAGYVALKTFKRHPKLTVVAIVAYFGVGAALNAARKVIAASSVPVPPTPIVTKGYFAGSPRPLYSVGTPDSSAVW